nr:hypothetical protein [Tanacetum cinerariifolium]
ALPVDSSSSSHVVLMAQFGVNRASLQAHYPAIGPSPGFPTQPFNPNASIVGKAKLPSQPADPAIVPPAQLTFSLTTPPQQFSISGTFGHATVLPHAFTAGTLHDPVTGV